MPSFLTLPIGLLSTVSGDKPHKVLHRFGLEQFELVSIGARSGISYQDVVVAEIRHRSGLTSADVSTIYHRISLDVLGYQDLFHRFGLQYEEIEEDPIRLWNGVFTENLELTEVQSRSGVTHTVVEDEIILDHSVRHHLGVLHEIEVQIVDHRSGVTHSNPFATAPIFFDADTYYGDGVWLNSGTLGGYAYSPTAAQSPPVVVASDLNNRKVIQFDGTDDYFISDPLFCAVAALYVVFKWSATPVANDGIVAARAAAGKAPASNEAVLVLAGSTTTTRNIFGSSTATGAVLNGVTQTTATYNGTAGIPTATNWNMLTHIKSNTVAGTKYFAIGADTSGTAITTRTAPVSIACIIGFDTYSTEQLQQVQFLLRQYYGSFY